MKTTSGGGPAKQSLKLKGVKRLSDILSDGEQRVLSLALFLTEIDEAPGRPGIILDDPVCSLDDEWMVKIAARLVQEAGKLISTHIATKIRALAAACQKWVVSR